MMTSGAPVCDVGGGTGGGEHELLVETPSGK
jgi:hypothetical protein